MAQDPEGREDPPEEGSFDTSHELDMVSLYRSATVNAEIEADIIRGVLDSQGIPSLKLLAMGNPQLGSKVQVHRANLQRAERLIEEAKAAGPAAAMEAEKNSER